MGKCLILVGVADEYLVCVLRDGNRRGGFGRCVSKPVGIGIRSQHGQRGGQMLQPAAPLGMADEQAHLMTLRHPLRKVAQHFREVIEAKVLQLIIAEKFIDKLPELSWVRHSYVLQTL